MIRDKNENSVVEPGFVLYFLKKRPVCKINVRDTILSCILPRDGELLFMFFGDDIRRMGRHIENGSKKRRSFFGKNVCNIKKEVFVVDAPGSVVISFIAKIFLAIVVIHADSMSELLESK